MEPLFTVWGGISPSDGPLSWLPWLQDEVFDRRKGPGISDLVAKETVDKLSYMGWELDQSADPVKVFSQDTLSPCPD